MSQIVYKLNDVEEAAETILHSPIPLAAPPKNGKLSDTISHLLTKNGYDIVHQHDMPGKAASYHDGAIELCNKATSYIRRNYCKGLYIHQYAAAKLADEGKNVCIATSTSSGKTAIFHMAALSILEKDPDAKIIAVYPMKALGSQQKNNWGEKLEGIKCGRIDGSIKDQNERLRILKENNIVTFTPDTIHTFLLGRLNNTKCASTLRSFISKLKLVIIDEIHLYRGMLGSNSAYLFRRLNSCVLLSSGNIPQYITASATISEPALHSCYITGATSFELIDSTFDGSPSCPTKIFMIEQGNGLVNLLTKLTAELPKECRTITFIDNRKDVTEVAFETEDALNLKENGIYPFKSGMEADDFRQITQVLDRDQFRGVVSTSSLEVGIDIGSLNVAILKGIPNSSTSFYQRIGRVGRGNNSNEAVVIIMNDPNSLITQRMFETPSNLFSLSPEEPALYLDNDNLMFIQALHFVGAGEEFISIARSKDDYKKIEYMFSEQFNKICNNMLQGQIDLRYHDIHDNGGDDPETVYTIRQFDVQYKAHVENEPDNGRGDLSMTNILREAYPGAIYTYWGDPRRVKAVHKDNRKEVILAKQITRNLKTSPIQLRWITPQRDSSVKQNARYGKLLVNNLDIIEKTEIRGYTEKDRKGNKRNILYADTEANHYYSKSAFSHEIRTTGVIFIHPRLNDLDKGQRSLISMLLYECFLSCYAFERSDIEYGAGILNTDIGEIKTNSSYIAIYDKVVGGLNISSRLLKKDALEKGFKEMITLIDKGQERIVLGDAVLTSNAKNVIRQIYNEIKENEPIESQDSVVSGDGVARESKAYYMINTNDEEKIKVTVEEISFNEIERKFEYLLIDENENEYERIDGSLVYGIPGESKRARFSKKGMLRMTDELW